MPLSQVLHVEDAIQRISRRMPEMRVMESLICRVITILGRDLTTRLDEALQPAGLAELEFRTLLTIFSRDGSATPGDLSAALAQSPANLTRLSDSLVERGLITRNPDLEDRRRMLLTLQPAGEQLVRSLMPRIGPEISAAFADFTATEKQQLLGSLKRLMAGIDSINAIAVVVREENA